MHPLGNLHVEFSLAENQLVLGLHVPEAVEEDRQDVGAQLARQRKRPFVETQDVTVRRARALREDADGVAAII